MSGDNIPKRKKRRFISFIILLVVLAILTIIIVSTLSNGGLGSSRLLGFFSPRTSEISVDEFNFDIGRARMFAGIDGSVAAVGTLGVKVLDAEGRETLRDSFRMNQPVISSSGDQCIAFDIGGTSVRVFNRTQVTSSIETDGTVVSASLNPNGWFCIVTQEGVGYRGIVTVYNSSGSEVYKVSLGSGFILSAELSHDNKTLAILNLIDTGSRITFYDLDVEDEPINRFDYSGGLIFDVVYLPNGDVLAFSTDLLFIVERSGNSRILHSFHDNRLGGYAYDKNFIALHLYDYGVGFQGQLITFNTDGTILGEIASDREIISMSAVDNSLIILKSDGITFYNHELEAFPVSAESISAAGANRVLAISEDVAVATNDNSAVVIRREEEQ